MKVIKHFIQAFAIALVAASCGGSNGTTGGEEPAKKDGSITLTADRAAICSDGSDFVTFTVTLKADDGSVTDITDEAEIYLSTTDELLDSYRFSTDKKGEYSFYAAYGLEMSEDVTVSAVPVIPEIPDDPQASATAFKHRMLLIEHTGATCPNCPLMMNALKTVEENEAYSSRFNLVAAHSYDYSFDAAYSDAAEILTAAFNTSSTGNRPFPTVTFNLTKTSAGHSETEICSMIDELSKESASVGIAMGVEAADGEIFANVEFKFGKTGEYRIGAWLLEDDVYATQTGATEEWHHIHNNAIRAMHSTNAIERLYGTKLDKTDAGSKVSHLFRFTVDKDWEAENCKVFVFVTEAVGDSYDIVNCAVCPAGETTGYEYK